MATNNKVKFVLPKQHGEQFYAPSPSAQIMAEHFGDEPAPTPVEEAEQHPHRTYHLVLFTTKANTNDEDKYTVYANEARSEEDIQHRISAFKGFVDTQLSEGHITGFILKVYRISPFISNTGMLMITNYRKFEAKKDKVFLNGPLKNNEFLQKKGKMYAQN